jgi:hypothetical protein
MPSRTKLDGTVTGAGLLHPLQDSDDFQGLGGESLQRRDDLEALRGCTLAERYLKSDLSVILELGLKGNRLPVSIGRRKKRNVESVNASIFVLKFHAFDACDGEHWNEEMVLVVNVEIAEGEKIAVPSLVTLHLIEHEQDDGRGFRYFSAFRERGFKFLSCPGGVDWELSVLGRGFSAHCVNCGTPRNIKSASEVVNSIANNQSNVGAQCSVSKEVVEELFPRIAIDVQAGSVCVRRGAESLLNIRDVLVGPFDL